MNKPRLYNESQKMFLINHSEEYDIHELVMITGMPILAIRNFCSRHELRIKPITKEDHIEHIREAKAMKQLPALAPAKISRPAAVYSNSTPYGIASEYLNGKI